MIRRAVLGLALVAFCWGCTSKLDTSRESSDVGTFGDTVVTLACKRIAYLEDLADGDDKVDVRGDTYRDICRLGLAPPAEAPDTLKALQAKRDTLVGSIDATFPADFLTDLQTFLTSNDFLALYDDDTTIESIDALVAFLEFLADDPELGEALERLNLRLGYMPTTPALGTVRAVMNYPDMHTFLLEVIDQIVEGGQARAEWDNLVEALGVTMRNAAPVQVAAAPDRTGTLAQELLFAERPLLGTGRPIPLVRRDYRGVARVANPTTAPFADMDADGLADTDALGQFVDADNQVLAVPAPFELPEGDSQVPWGFRDAEGRPLIDDGGDLIYEYVDLDKTVFAALSRDALQLFDPTKGTALDMMRGGSALMGARMMATREFDNGESLEYRGYDTTESPLLDMVYGYLGVLDDPNIYHTLALGRELLTNNEPEIARLVEAVVGAARMGDDYPEAVIEAGSPIWDGVIPVARAILAEPGLAEDLLRAMEDPLVAELPLRFAEFMKYKDQINYDSNQNVVGSLTTEVNRGAVDSAFNRSLMQRILHLIADSDGAQLCNKQDGVVTDPLGIGLPLQSYDECELLQIDNVAVFFVQAIAYNKDGNGNIIYEDDGSPQPKARFDFNWNNWLIESLVSDDLLQDMTTIEGFKTHPTPQALARAMFLDPMPDFLSDVMDPAVCADGDLYTSAHSGTLQVWELNNFYDQMRPIIQVFADHDAEQLFVDLLVVLHDHWPSRDSIQHQQTDPNGHGYAFASDVHSYEPLVIEILEDRSLMDALVYSSPALNATSANGRSFERITTDAARYLLTPRAGLAKRNGDTTTTTADGRPVNTLSPWHLLADAYQLKDDRIAAAGPEGAAWQSSIANVIDVLVRAHAVPQVGWQFSNPSFRGVSLALIEFLEERLAAHDTAGDRHEWLTEGLPNRTEEILSGPVFAGAADFILVLGQGPAREQIEKMVQYLVDEATDDETFDTSVTALADILQLALDDDDIIPIARVIGEAMRPERGWLETHLTFAQAARRSDANEALVSMLRNLYVEYRPGHTAVGDLIDGISEVKRARPWEDIGERYTAEDYRALFRGVAGFLDEEKRGLRKFIQIIESRNL